MLLQGPGQILTFERSTDIISPSYSKICFTVAVLAALAALAVVVIILLLLAGLLAAGLLLAFRLAVGLLAGLLAGLLLTGSQSIWWASNILICLINFYRISVFLEHFLRLISVCFLETTKITLNY